MKGICCGELTVDTVKEVLLVALGVKDGELRRIEKASGVEAIELKEVSPVLSAIAEIDGACGGAEGAVGTGDVANRLRESLAGARGDVDDEAGLAAVFRGRCTGDHLKRLHRV